MPTRVAAFFCEELLRNGTTSALVFPTVHEQFGRRAFRQRRCARDMRLISGKVLMDLGPDGLSDTPARARCKARR